MFIQRKSYLALGGMLAGFGLMALTAFGADLTTIRKVYVADMGQGQDATHFRMVMQDQLSTHGFDVTSQPDQADAFLRGDLNVAHTPDGIRASVKVHLDSKDGATLWGQDFEPSIQLFGNRDSIERRAEEVAGALREAKDEAVSAKADKAQSQHDKNEIHQAVDSLKDKTHDLMNKLEN